MSRVYVPLMGGVGNLLFEYCAALGLQAAHPGRVTLVPESDALVHRLAAYVGELAVPVAGRNDRRRLGDVFAAPSNKITRSLNVLGRHVVEFTISQRLAPAAAKPARTPRLSVYYDTYFQHPSWYDHCVDEVLDQLAAERPAGIPSLLEGTVAVHLRRSDYVPLGWALALEYYERCLVEMRRMGFDRVVTASDDAMVKRLLDLKLAAEGWTVVDTSAFGAPSARTDFHLVASCAAVVMSNSTFSWWSVKLREHTAPRGSVPILCPDSWIEGAEHLIAENWTRIAT